MDSSTPFYNTNVGGDAVFVVEDDRQTRDALRELFSPVAAVHTFASAEEFLRVSPIAHGPACLLLDERLPGMSGSELLQRLHAEQRSPSAVLVTAYADTPVTVAAMRHGAVTVLDKPCGDSALREAVREALAQDRRQIERDTQRSNAAQALEKLNSNEREVLQMVLDGVPNKQIASRVGVCVRTIESRRSRIYAATGVRSVAELVRLCVTANFVDA
ncbi:MAG: response regulator [Planctomycetota bacterium]